MYDIDKLSRDIYEAISGDIQKKFRDHYNMVIVGNNSTGKTSLIECLLNTVKQQKRKDFYYIDPKNRTVYEPEEEGGYSLDLESITAYDIISSRIHKKVMAKKDIFVDKKVRKECYGIKLKINGVINTKNNKFKCFLKYLNIFV